MTFATSVGHSRVICPPTSTMSANLDVVDENNGLVVDCLKYQSDSSGVPAVWQLKLFPVDNLLVRPEFLPDP